MATRFSPDAQRVLDELEKDDKNIPFVNAIWDVIDLITTHPTPALARRRSLRTVKGHHVWAVPIAFWHDDERWLILWRPDGNDEDIAYIGPDDFRPRLT